MDKHINDIKTNKDELITNLDFIKSHWDLPSTMSNLKNEIPTKRGLFSKIQDHLNSRLINRLNSIADQQAIFNSFVSQTLNQLADQISQKKVTQLLNQFSDQIVQNNEKVTQSLNQFNDLILQNNEKVSQSLNQFNDQIFQNNEKQLREIENLAAQINTIKHELIDQNNHLSRVVQSRNENSTGIKTDQKENFSYLKERNSEAITDLQHRMQVIETAEQANLNNLCQRVREIDGQINDLIRNINEVDRSLKPRISANQESSQIPLKNGFNYFQFEEIFRGTEELIKERQCRYIPFFKGKEKVVDLGSGRGEFLVLLNEEGIQGTGVDCDQEMILRSREKGLVVIQQDIFEYLDNIPDKSIDGIFSAQVIEHLPFEKLDLFFKRSYSKLKNDGILIVETVNPYNLSAFRCFYLDPTHQKPLFPELISYICRRSGFNETEVIYIPPDERAQLTGISKPDDQWACGDYAVIAKKREFHA